MGRQFVQLAHLNDEIIANELAYQELVLTVYDEQGVELENADQVLFACLTLLSFLVDLAQAVMQAILDLQLHP